MLLADNVTDLFHNGTNFVNVTIPRFDKDVLDIEGIDTLTRANTSYVKIDNEGRIGVHTKNPEFVLHVNGTSRFTKDAVFEGDVFIRGVTFGGSPLKVAGGLTIHSGGINVSNGDIEDIGNVHSINVTADDAVVAEQIIDLTPAFEGNTSDALESITYVKSETRNNLTLINHSSLPEFARRTVVVRDKSYNKVVTEGRDIGAMVTVLVESIKELVARNDRLIQENQNMKTELCRVNNSYSWCRQLIIPIRGVDKI